LHHQQPPLTTTQSPLETEEYIEKQKQKEEGKAETEERKGSDRGKKYIPEEQPQLPPCFLSTATAHHLIAADTAISNRR
jgi:hypothetical protein